MASATYGKCNYVKCIMANVTEPFKQNQQTKNLFLKNLHFILGFVSINTRVRKIKFCELCGYWGMLPPNPQFRTQTNFLCTSLLNFTI